MQGSFFQSWISLCLSVLVVHPYSSWFIPDPSLGEFVHLFCVH